MSFFGFETALPRDRGHPTNAPGFGQAPDPFAAISRGEELQGEGDDDDDALDFEDTYDGLGDRLDETDDVLNDETFGDEEKEASKAKPVGRDFDFFGQTQKVSTAMDEEQQRFSRYQPPRKPAEAISERSPPKAAKKPARTGYEKYKEPEYIPDLQANASLWGASAKKSVGDGLTPLQKQQGFTDPGPVQESGMGKKMMSLEEVEAAMRNPSKKPASSQQTSEQMQGSTYPTENQAQPTILHRQTPSKVPMQTHPPSAGQPPRQAHQPLQQTPQELPPFTSQQPSRTRPKHQLPPREQITQGPPPRQILQNPNRRPGPGHAQADSVELPQLAQPRTPSAPSTASQQVPLVTHPQQLLNFSEEERAAYLIEDARRAKRNHKIYLLSKDNGLMTPQDKNFITRIQLQQLVTATGNPNEQSVDAVSVEDFYYQVHSQIRGGLRQNPHQPLNHFAQTYLFQTGGQNGAMGRRYNRSGDNHMQRMEQQVQRAVEAAKLKPKNKQLVIEGSLGKISFSNAKTPKPLLNIKRTESGNESNRPHSSGKAHHTAPSGISVSDRKSVLRHVENAYSILMQMEDHDRNLPPQPSKESNEHETQQHSEWRRIMNDLNQQLWSELKVMEPFMPDASIQHPFIAFLSYPKGKKAIPRIFRYIDQDQRVFIVTMIVAHIGLLDVVRNAQLQSGETQLPASVREQVELFSHAVMPSLFGYVNEAPLQIVFGLLGVLLDRANVQRVARTKIGLGILTMFVSRAELVKQAGEAKEQEWGQWTSLYNRLFDTLEPVFSQIFPESINSGDDTYVWQFLAAIGLGASPQQQQRLVMAVNVRVMETVNQSKTLPPDMSSQRLANVNLFMRAIGLDVELLG
ncbi:MAG: hypothetical protein M1837_007028 [Sclerophora amabilis]|nr:MAG: hypothetical protein M1837_007028 [Sclerophora amabilis]